MAPRSIAFLAISFILIYPLIPQRFITVVSSAQDIIPKRLLTRQSDSERLSCFASSYIGSPMFITEGIPFWTSPRIPFMPYFLYILSPLLRFMFVSPFIVSSSLSTILSAITLHCLAMFCLFISIDRLRHLPAAQDIIPKRNNAPLWVFTPLVELNIFFSPYMPTALSFGSKSFS